MKTQLSPKLFTTKALAIFMFFAIGFSMFSVVGKIDAQSVDELRQRANDLQSNISSNQAAANKKHKHAENLEDAIGELDGEISSATSQIYDTSEKISRLTTELQQKQKELVRAKELLKLNMQALYKNGDASTVELLVGSDSFSEYIDEQEYLERIKIGIQDSANKVIKIKKQIKSQKEQKEEELAKQEATKSALDNLRGQRADLLEKTRGEEAEYREVVEELKVQRAAVDRQITELIQAASQSSGGGVASEGGQIIGRVGTTGFSTGCHLHFEMRNSSGQVFNPRQAMGIWPVSGSISQDYGNPSSWYVGGFHPGIDIVTSPPCGVPVRATKPGKIFRIPNDPAYGNLVIIKHNDGTSSVYGHLSSFN